MWMRPFVADPGDLTEEVIDDAGRSTPAAAAQTLSIARREIARGRLARQARIIKIPLLVVAGEEDQIVDPQSVGVWAGGVDKAEICLIDGCGHLPMIERTAEFDAQVLAFLTGDARYLDYAGGAAADEDLSDEDLSDEDLPEDDQTGEETETRYLGESNEAYATDPSEPTDDTADLTPYRPDIEEAEPERARAGTHPGTGRRRTPRITWTGSRRTASPRTSPKNVRRPGIARPRARTSSPSCPGICSTGRRRRATSRRADATAAAAAKRPGKSPTTKITPMVRKGQPASSRRVRDAPSRAAH
jgi:hypothetical protein